MGTYRIRACRTALLLLLLLGLAACTASQPDSGGPGAPGLLLGLWHGFIAPVTFIVSLFTDQLRIYAVPNTGVWYDLGFMLGIGGFSGGLFAGSRRRTTGSRA